MKPRFPLLGLVLLLFAFIACSPSAQGAAREPSPTPAVHPAASPAPVIRLATFNIRGFSDRSRDDDELREIAELVVPYDIIALQETRDVPVLERLVRLLSLEFHREFSFSASPKLKSGGGELYAILWRRDRITALTDIRLVDDPGNRFIREPAWQYFKAIGDGFDFALVDFHALFGDSATKRRAELVLLGGLLQTVMPSVHALSPGEADCILAGDFNMVCTDRAFDSLREAGYAPLVPAAGTTIHDSPYDNIWTASLATREYAGLWGMVRFDETDFDNDDARASLAISDHRPVWAEFAAGPDDD